MRAFYFQQGHGRGTDGALEEGGKGQNCYFYSILRVGRPSELSLPVNSHKTSARRVRTGTSGEAVNAESKNAGEETGGISRSTRPAARSTHEQEQAIKQPPRLDGNNGTIDGVELRLLLLNCPQLLAARVMYKTKHNARAHAQSRKMHCARGGGGGGNRVGE